MDHTKTDFKIITLMATYNGDRHLDEQIQSLVNQQGIKTEILVRDDGSTDLTHSILNKWQEKGVLTWYTGPRLNAAGSFMDLIYKAPEADFYCLCDQDDVWDDDKISVAVRKLIELPEEIPNLYCSSTRLVDKDLKLIKNHSLSSNRNKESRFLVTHLTGCTMVFNFTLIKKLRLYKPAYLLIHDTWIYKVCAALGGHIVFDEVPHISYRQHGNNVYGMETNIKSKLRKGYEFIFISQLKRQIECLYDLYKDEMTDEYRHLCEKICNYDKSLGNYLEFLFDRTFYYHSIALDISFRIKVLLHKL